jgi:oligopeptide/dipeptide ABC transporter ATP-binding protein
MNKLIIVENLRQYFEVESFSLNPFKKDVVRAVDNVSLEIEEKQVLGLVGESGCGKTTLGKTMLRLIEPTAGKIIFQGTDITHLKNRSMKKFRKDMQMIYQNSSSSMDPRMTVSDIISEPLAAFNIVDSKDKDEKVAELLDLVLLGYNRKDCFPHELSGGERQRVVIARALASNPKFVVADEPVSSLDVSIRAQILNLLKDINRRFGITFLYISHDISTTKHIADTIGIMYLGKIVEIGPFDKIFKNPKHPYAQALFSSILIPDPLKKSRKRIILKGEPANPIKPPSGCRFHPRCPLAIAGKCENIEPQLVKTAPRHYVACLREDVLQ